MDKSTKNIIGILLLVIIMFLVWKNSGNDPPTSIENETFINETSNSTVEVARSAGGGGGGGSSTQEADPPVNETGNNETNQTNTTTPDYNNWTVDVTATNQLEGLQFGTHSAATDGYDADFDNFTTFPQVGYVIMSLDSAYAVSIKNFENNSENWTMAISVPNGQTTNVTVDYSNLRSEVNVTFSWNTTYFDIRDNSSFSLGEGDNTIQVSAVG